MNAPAPFTPSQCKRLRSERRPVLLNGCAVLKDGRYADVLVLNMSYEGCAIECSISLVVGEEIKFAVLRRGAIVAEVQWISGLQAGLKFKNDESERPQWPRRSERSKIDAEVVFRRQSHLHFHVRVLDFSPLGCKLEFVEKPQIGELVWIKIDGLESLEGKVCWVKAEYAGVKFSRSIHPAVFEMLLARL